MTRTDVSALARMRASLDSLVPSEARVAAIILERPNEVVAWSTAELAEAAGTSAATVIRACQSLGYRGFQHLRLEVARSTPLTPFTDAPAQAPDVFEQAIDALRLAGGALDRERLEASIDLLQGARRIVLVGSGFSGPPLQDFAMRLATNGHSVEAPIDALAQQFAAHSLAAGDVCLAVSYSGANAQTLRACTAAGERGATIILVTSYRRSPLGRLADVVLSTGPAGSAHDVDPFLARLGHQVVLHALSSALGRDLDHADVAEMRHVVADAIADD